MKIELCTKRTHGDYERTLYIYVEKSKDEIPYIDSDDHCKLIFIRKGSMTFTVNNSGEFSYKAPMALFVSERDQVVISSKSHFQATTIYFKPVAINDAFTYDRLYSGEFEDLNGTTIYQDYLTVRHFIMKDGLPIKCSHLTDISLANMTKLVANMEYELNEQYDGYWPCRSRSYFIEILFQLNFCFNNNPYIFDKEQSFVARVIEYLNQHIDEKMDLDTLTSEFHVNRNYLNKTFVDETGLTCLNYLLKIRMDLAKLWLTETEIPVQEIGRRLGYLDQNYFTKVFRKETNLTPSEYRVTQAAS